MFKKSMFFYPVLLSSTLFVTGCLDHDDDDEHNETTAANCIESAKEVTLSDDRVLCVTLTAFKAEAPFTAGFNAPGKVTHTVFISDSNGNPVNVGTDTVVSAIAQYPMMYMNAGHSHSAPFKSADTSAAEYGAYNFDVYYPMASAMMDGTEMGTWEYRVKITDNKGTASDTSDDVTHTVKFEPAVAMLMSSKAFRAVGKNENDKFKNAMDTVADRQYSAWLDSVSRVNGGVASVNLYVTTQDVDHSGMTGMTGMSKPSARDADHTMDGDEHAMGDEDSTSYPAVYAPMDIMGTTMTLTLHGDDGTTEIGVATANVEVSTDNGTTWTTLTAGMTHDTMGHYTGDVAMEAGAVEMLVRITVNDNIMTRTGAAADGTDAEDMPSLKFTAVAVE